MEARAKLSYARISSRKVKIVIDMIRNKPEAVDNLDVDVSEEEEE